MVLLHLVLYDLPKIDFNTNPGAVYLWRPRQWQTLDHGRSLSSYRCIFFKTVLLLYLVSNFISLFFTLPWLSLNKILFLLIHTDGNSTSVLYSVDGEIQSKWDYVSVEAKIVFVVPLGFSYSMLRCICFSTLIPISITLFLISSTKTWVHVNNFI